MPASQQTIDFLQKARQEGPDYWKGLPDDVLYFKLQTSNSVPKEISWKEQDIYLPNKNQITEPGADSKSSDISTLQAASDYFIDENSPDWMKAAYVNSLTGSTEQLITGKARYDVDQSDFNLLEDIGA